MTHPNYAVAEAYLAAVAAGDLPDSLLTDDMTAWLTAQGTISKAAYQGAIRLFARMAKSPIRFTVDAMTAQDDRVVIEAHLQATLINGEAYGGKRTRRCPGGRPSVNRCRCCRFRGGGPSRPRLAGAAA